MYTPNIHSTRSMCHARVNFNCNTHRIHSLCYYVCSLICTSNAHHIAHDYTTHSPLPCYFYSIKFHVLVALALKRRWFWSTIYDQFFFFERKKRRKWSWSGIKLPRFSLRRPVCGEANGSCSPIIQSNGYRFMCHWINIPIQLWDSVCNLHRVSMSSWWHTVCKCSTFRLMNWWLMWWCISLPATSSLIPNLMFSILRYPLLLRHLLRIEYESRVVKIVSSVCIENNNIESCSINSFE